MRNMVTLGVANLAIKQQKDKFTARFQEIPRKVWAPESIQQPFINAYFVQGIVLELGYNAE